MIEQLFGSKTRVKLLHIFFREPDKSFFVRELSRATEVQINAIRRELELLVSLEIINEKDEEHKKKQDAESGEVGASLRKYYRLNSESIIYSELQALLIKDSVAERAEFILELQNKIGDIRLLVLTGEFTNAKRAPTDLFIVGAVKHRALAKVVEDYEKEFGFSIRYTVMSESEFVDRRYVMDKFVYSVFEAEHLKVVDKLGV